MGKVDSLSRRPDWKVGVEKDNEDEMLVKPEWLEVRKTEAVEIIVDRVDLLEEVRKSKVKDDEVVKAVEEMKRAGVKMLRDEEWKEVDGIMYKEGKVYVPKDEKLRAEIIRLHHDTPIGGHYKGTPNTPLRSSFQSSGATLKPIQYYYVILGLTPIIPRALCCHPAYFPCSDPGY